MVEALGEVAGNLDRNRLLHLVTEHASRLVEAERSSIFLVDPDTNEMIFQVAYRSPDLERSPGTSGGYDQRTRYHSQQSGRTQPGQQTYLADVPGGEFSYFNRSAITVPLRSGPLAHGHGEARKHILGGLMVLNRQNAAFQEEDAQLMRMLANQASTFLQVAEMYESTGELFLGVIRALSAAVDAKDPYTQGHSQRVSDYAVLISQELGLDEALVSDIRIGSLLHDIGKIGIPDAILLKNSKLSDRESGFIRQHPRTGVNILNQVRLLEPVIPAILEHHERLNGSGYPAKLVDKQISLMGRIVAVADVYDAMTSNRPYRLALTEEKVLSHLYENAGILFDPVCVQALENVLDRPNQDFQGNHSAQALF
jgi:putative nucleotidyltransferase with HDIG domain